MDKKIIIKILILREADYDILNQNCSNLITTMNAENGLSVGGS
jgi:hypothetical protein